MKKEKILYWVYTSLFATFTLFTSLTQTVSAQTSVSVMGILKLPFYLLPFLGIVKMLGLIVIFIPGFPKIKEWAYAGFLFDYIGATYCMIAVGGTIGQWGFMIVPITLCMLSYIHMHKLKKVDTRISYEPLKS